MMILASQVQQCYIANQLCGHSGVQCPECLHFWQQPVSDQPFGRLECCTAMALSFSNQYSTTANAAGCSGHAHTSTAPLVFQSRRYFLAYGASQLCMFHTADADCQLLGPCQTVEHPVPHMATCCYRFAVLDNSKFPAVTAALQVYVGNQISYAVGTAQLLRSHVHAVLWTGRFCTVGLLYLVSCGLSPLS